MWVRNAAVLVFGLLLLVAQSSLGVLLPTHPVSPMLLLPVVLHLGVSPEITLVRGALTAFVLGWLLDEFCGAPMGLATFALVATYLVTHGAVNQLFLRSTPSQILLTFAVTLLAGGTMLALRAIFGPPEAFPLGMPAGGAIGALFGANGRAGGVIELGTELVGAAIVTAALSPPIFWVMARIDQSGTRARRADRGVAT